MTTSKSNLPPNQVQENGIHTFWTVCSNEVSDGLALAAFSGASTRLAIDLVEPGQAIVSAAFALCGMAMTIANGHELFEILSTTKKSGYCKGISIGLGVSAFVTGMMAASVLASAENNLPYKYNEALGLFMGAFAAATWISLRKTLSRQAMHGPGVR